MNTERLRVSIRPYIARQCIDGGFTGDALYELVNSLLYAYFNGSVEPPTVAPRKNNTPVKHKTEEVNEADDALADLFD